MVVFVLQVQLLVSEEDVENYKKIKASLDQLRLTVEKSELWVEKSGGYGNEDIAENQSKEQNLEVRTYWKNIASIFLNYNAADLIPLCRALRIQQREYIYHLIL